ncbi:MAG TPA: glycosyl transferase family 51, partial [Duganella sp.]
MPPDRPNGGKSKRSRNAFIVVLLIGATFAVYWGVHESRTSDMQARIFTDMANKLTYKVQPGASNAIRFPHDSPYDERLGYASLPDYLAKLRTRDYHVTAQARISPKMVELADMGIFATYHEKTKTGLTIYDCRAQELFAASYPERIYNKFEQAPMALINSLLYIEN